jgi:hypothetical protein
MAATLVSKRLPLRYSSQDTWSFVVEHTGMFERQWREFLVRVRSRLRARSREDAWFVK